MSRCCAAVATLAATAAAITSLATAAKDSTVTIVPGGVWNDTDGNLIQAHGGGMIQVGKTYYWFGEDHTRGLEYKRVPCYASTDLLHWRFRGYALDGKSGTVGDLGVGRVLERPKVLYNAKTKTYVMYMHIDSGNYREAKVGVATSPTVDGAYTYRGSFQPLGHQSRDMSLFQDRNGAGYLLFEDRASGVRIQRLTDDYLAPAAETCLIPKSYEGLAVMHVGDTYYLVGSHLSGWDANANEYATAPSLAGPWSAWHQIAPPATRTYDSQTAFILPIVGTKTTTYMYGGDRWNRGRDLATARYIWMPLDFDPTAHTLRLPPDDPWLLDVATGVARMLPPAPPLLAPGDYHLTTKAGDKPLGIATFHLASAGRGNTVTFADPKTGDVLDVTGQSVDPGIAVALYMPNGGANQTWRLAPVPNAPSSFTITSVGSDLRLTLTGGRLTQERPRPQGQDDGQVWKITR